MFDELLRELDKLSRGVRLPVQVPLDEDGYLDRQCPAHHCHTEFKVHFEDWKAKGKDDGVFCPICRKEAPADAWNTSEQVQYLKEIVFAHIKDTFDRALAIDIRRFNSRQRPGFIQLSLSFKPSAPPVMVPIDAANVMRQKFTCEACSCRYASVGAAFFCVACGHNSVLATFDQTLETVRKTMASLPNITVTLAAGFDDDVVQNTIREILENHLGRLVGAFEHLARALYEKFPTGAKLPRKNVFQNVSDGSTLWRTSTGKGYEDFLSPAEMHDLTRLFQQRHVLTYGQGIVDQDYLNRTGDHTYAVGQRLVVRWRTWWPSWPRGCGASSPEPPCCYFKVNDDG